MINHNDIIPVKSGFFRFTEIRKLMTSAKINAVTFQGFPLAAKTAL